MPRVRATRLTVTGHVVFDQNFGGCGDILLYWRDLGVPEWDAGTVSRQARQGYFCASIFDGVGWRKLHLSHLLPYAERAYQRAAQRPRVAEALKQAVRQWRGESALYNDDSCSFRLAARELL